MRCPYCKAAKTSVIDSRSSKGGDEIRRRRYCDPADGGCGGRFTSFERLERNLPMVIKKDGERQPYDRNKIRNGLLRSATKTGVSTKDIENFLNHLERIVADRWPREMRTKEIGDEVLKFLRQRDAIAYIRFASVYGDFKSIEEFKKLIGTLSGDKHE